MEKYNRTELITSIAKKLSFYDIEMIKLILKSFNIPIIISQEIDKYDYVKKQLSQNGVLSSLTDIAMFLDIEEKNYSIKKEPLWKDNYFKIFISHLPSNNLNAIALKKRLEKYGISAISSRLNIYSIIEDKIKTEEALKTCDSLVALLSKKFHKSYKTNQETGVGIGRNLNILSIQMANFKPKGMLANYPIIELDDIDQIAKHIFTALIQDDRTKESMAYSLMHMFENSTTFSSVKENIRLLEENTFWNSDLIDRLKRAPDNNSQIWQSIGVKERINDIDNKYKR